MTRRNESPASGRRSPRRRTPSNVIPLNRSLSIPILYEDSHVLAIDKPNGWMTTTARWSHTKQNLQREIEIAITKRDPWVMQKQIRFLRFVHRLDRETSGVLLLAKSRHALTKVGKLFSEQRIQKLYLCVVRGSVPVDAWKCTAPISPSKNAENRMKVDLKEGQNSTTLFRCLKTSPSRSLIIANPQTGRTHQIRVHLAASGHAIIGDPLYGERSEKPSFRQESRSSRQQMGLRAWAVRFRYSPKHKPITILASSDAFLRQFAPHSRLPTLNEVFNSVEELNQSSELFVSKTGRLPNGPSA